MVTRGHADCSDTSSCLAGRLACRASGPVPEANGEGRTREGAPWATRRRRRSRRRRSAQSERTWAQRQGRRHGPHPHPHRGRGRPAEGQGPPGKDSSRGVAVCGQRLRATERPRTDAGLPHPGTGSGVRPTRTGGALSSAPRAARGHTALLAQSFWGLQMRARERIDSPRWPARGAGGGCQGACPAEAHSGGWCWQSGRGHPSWAPGVPPS